MNSVVILCLVEKLSAYHGHWSHVLIGTEVKKGPKLRTRFAENNFKIVVPQKMLSKCHAKVIIMIKYYIK